MFTPELARLACNYQLEELLQDPEFLRVIDLNTKEVTRFWSIPAEAARGFVLSAIGEPETLACIYNAWLLAKHTDAHQGLAKVIVRRRVIDLLRKDARPTNHCSLPTTADAIQSPDVMEADAMLGSFHESLQGNPRAQLELRELIQLVQDALACFEVQGRAQQRQAQLLRRYALDEVKYPQLSLELTCSENALRGRVHKAMIAFRTHIRECHSELLGLLGREHRG